MKIHLLKKWQWWVIVLAFMMICVGCASKPQKPDTTPPESREPAPSPGKPTQVPKESKTPSQEPSRPPAGTLPAPSQEAQPVKKESYYTHTVKWDGETLFLVALWYTGDRENWKVLAEVMTQNNPNVNIHRIRSGDKILIPENILKTRDPMPKDFVDNFYHKSKTEKAPSKPAPSQTKEEEPELFGPKELPKK
jgi:Tfp pilus assembly protein FimV